jgi:hypothetical protein
MIAHELFGHAYHADRGTTILAKDPATGIEYSEEQGMAAENSFNKSAGRDPQKTYDQKQLPQWSINGDIITGSRMRGSRICPKDESGNSQNSC